MILYPYLKFKGEKFFLLFSGCRSDTVEHILCTSLFPAEFSVKDNVKTWVRLFSKFDKVEIKALEKILEQKQRFVMIMGSFYRV